MTEQQRIDYERAAVALETHALLVDENNNELTEPWAVVSWKAWDICNMRNDLGPIDEVDLAAARLLRECIARNEVLNG